MIIEIHGAGFFNKGAQLMLLTVAERLRRAGAERGLDVTCCVEAEYSSGYEHAAPEGLRLLAPIVSLQRPNRYPLLFLASRAAGRLMPARACRQLGLVRRQDTDALIDVSGYAFGDKFPWTRCRNAAIRAEHYRRRGKPVVLLPQMLGPFENPKVRGQFARLARAADRVYAREQASHDAALPIVGAERLGLAPDITIFSPRFDVPAPETPPRDYACIVPNEKMLAKGGKEWASVYLERLAAAARRIHAAGLEVVIVVHDASGHDEKLAAELHGSLTDIGATVFTHPHAAVLKSFVASSRFLVGSRFHSIVAALSSGVPAVALGWAHKYDLLASDFGVPDLIHRETDGEEHLLALCDELLDPASNERRRETLRGAKDALRAPADRMWDDVLSRLGLTPQGAGGASA